MQQRTSPSENPSNSKSPCFKGIECFPVFRVAYLGGPRIGKGIDLDAI